MSTSRYPIVLGVDDSPGADDALSWAVAEASSRRLPLRLISSYEWRMLPSSDYLYSELPGIDADESRRLAQQAIAMTIEKARGLDADVEVHGEVIDGEAGTVLLDESKRASTIVLGSRRHKALGSTLLGSVGGAVAAGASCPVVIVRGPAGDPADDPRVVAGVDGSAASETVLEFAFDYASRHGAPLHVVLCWHPDPLALFMWRPAPAAPERVQQWLAEVLAGWREKYPDVVLHRSVVRDRPVAGLVMESTDQRLLVVGATGAGARTATLLGSVSQGVLHHATCPVAVIPTR